MEYARETGRALFKDEPIPDMHLKALALPTAGRAISREHTLSELMLARHARSAHARIIARLVIATFVWWPMALCPGARATAPSEPESRTAGLAKLFAGAWHCSGRFANDRVITSSESFSPILRGQWLAEEHGDNPPFRYAAHALWGWDKEAQLFTLTVYDNFGGARLFTSKGWLDAALTFEVRELVSPVARRERFIYKMLPARGYSVEYQTLDKSNTWKLGDVLECTKAG